MYCTNCGNAVPENSNFCPKCGATVMATPPAPKQDEVYAEQYATNPVEAQVQQTAQPVEMQEEKTQAVYQQPAYSYDNTQHQPPVTPAAPEAQYQSQPETPAYESEPSPQNMYYTPQPEQDSPSIVLPVLSLAFGAVAFFFVFLAVIFSVAGTYAGMIVFATFAVLFSTAATPFGIIGLIKSIKAKFVKGIVLSAIGLGLVLTTISAMGAL